MAVLIEIGGRDASRGLRPALGSPTLDKGAVALIVENGIGFIALVALVAPHVEVEETVAVEIAPGRPHADPHRSRRKLHFLECAAVQVAIELAAFPAEQVEI